MWPMRFFFLLCHACHMRVRHRAKSIFSHRMFLFLAFIQLYLREGMYVHECTTVCKIFPQTSSTTTTRMGKSILVYAPKERVRAFCILYTDKHEQKKKFLMTIILAIYETRIYLNEEKRNDRGEEILWRQQCFVHMIARVLYIYMRIFVYIGRRVESFV